MAQDTENRYRLRLSITPELNEMLEDSATALGINSTALATFALSIGLRALRPMIHPMAIPGVSEVVEANTATQTQAVIADAADAGVPVRQGK